MGILDSVFVSQNEGNRVRYRQNSIGCSHFPPSVAYRGYILEWILRAKVIVRAITYPERQYTYAAKCVNPRYEYLQLLRSL